LSRDRAGPVGQAAAAAAGDIDHGLWSPGAVTVAFVLRFYWLQLQFSTIVSLNARGY